MRVLTFDPYNPEKIDELGRVAVQARAVNLLWAGVTSYPAGNVESTARGAKVFGYLQGLTEKNGEGRRLKPSGGRIVVSDEELNWLTNVLAKFREQITVGAADALMFLDSLLKDAPELPQEDLAKAAEKV